MKESFKHAFISAATCVAAAGGAFADIAIRSDYPGGNITVEKIDAAAGVVALRPDLRDTKGNWFHWDFTLSGAAGRTLRFQFPKGYDYLSSLGPAISRDGGKSWRWLNNDGRRHEPNNAFDYTFAPDESETRFAVSIPYTQKDWDAASARWRGREGVIDELLSGSPDAEWIRDNADCVFVPFMDKDGVEDGDQGKNRRPHDHNRDYFAGLYTSVRAFKELLVRESHGRRIVFFDLHSPHVRSYKVCPEQDCAFTFDSFMPDKNARIMEFRRNWADAQRGGALHSSTTVRATFSKGWPRTRKNTTATSPRGFPPPATGCRTSRTATSASAASSGIRCAAACSPARAAAGSDRVS